MEKNHFKGLTIKQSSKNRTDRKHFSDKQVTTILDALVGPDTPLVRKPYQKWGPLIALFTGMRLGEVSQLSLSDLKQECGIRYFDVNDEGDKNVKSAAGIRTVPVHERLVDLGLLSYVEEVRSSGATRLFPEFTYSKNNGYGRNLGRWFNEKFLPALSLKSDELVFHSLRHTVITNLLQQNVPMSVVQALVGHEAGSVTDQHYHGGYTMEQLHDAIHKLPYGWHTDNLVQIPVRRDAVVEM